MQRNQSLEPSTILTKPQLHRRPQQLLLQHQQVQLAAQQRPRPLQQQEPPSSRPLLVLRSPTLLAPHRLLAQQRPTRVPLPQLRRQPQLQAPQPQKLLAQHPVPV
ncbi:unnamed protein product, partial [Adineta steineri]